MTSGLTMPTEGELERGLHRVARAGARNAGARTMHLEGLSDLPSIQATTGLRARAAAIEALIHEAIELIPDERLRAFGAAIYGIGHHDTYETRKSKAARIWGRTRSVEIKTVENVHRSTLRPLLISNILEIEYDNQSSSALSHPVRAPQMETALPDDRSVSATPTLVKMLSLGDVATDVGEPEERATAAQSLILISGIDCKAMVESKSWMIQEALDRAVQVHVLCVDPRATAFMEVLRHLDRFAAPGSYEQSMAGVQAKLDELDRSRHFSYKLLPYLPSLNFFVVDPESATGSFKVEIYTPLGNKSGPGRPHLVIPPEMPEWRTQLLRVWQHYWDTANVGPMQGPAIVDQGVR
jgi:hypothetical protein